MMGPDDFIKKGKKYWLVIAEATGETWLEAWDGPEPPYSNDGGILQYEIMIGGPDDGYPQLFHESLKEEEGYGWRG